MFYYKQQKQHFATWRDYKVIGPEAHETLIRPWSDYSEIKPWTI